MSDEYTYRIVQEELKSSNWTPWQRRMLSVLRQLGLDKHVANENVPGVAKEGLGQTTEDARDARDVIGGCRDDRDNGRHSSLLHSCILLLKQPGADPHYASLSQESDMSIRL